MMSPLLGHRYHFSRALGLSCAATCLLCLTGCGAKATDAAGGDKPKSSPAVVVSVAEVVEKEVAPELVLVGTVTALRRTIVGSPVDGRVISLSVYPGDPVSNDGDGLDRGQPIAQLSTEMIGVEIEAAKAELKRLQRKLEELKSGLRPEEIVQAKAEWESAKAAKDYAEAQIKRFKPLQDTSVVSKEEYDAVHSAALAAEQALIAAKAGYELAKTGPRKEQIAQAEAEVERQKQEVSRLEIQQKYHTIRSPFNGFVVKRLTEVGQWLSRGTPVAELVSLDPIDVVVHVPESMIAQLSPGTKVPLSFGALGGEFENLEGVIQGIVPSADQRARTFPVHIRLANPRGKTGFLLKDGMQARAMIFGRPRPALFVPKDALTLGGSVSVMIADTKADGSIVARRVDIAAGSARDDLIEVQGQLAAGEQVITGGNERVQSGQLVKILTSD